MQLYDENGRPIGQAPQQSQPNFIQQILGSFLNPLDRIVRGSAQAGARTGANLAGAKNINDVLDGLIKGRNDSSKINFLNESENEAYKNPLNVAKDVASVAAPLIPGEGIVPLLASGGLAGFGGTYGNDEGTLMGTLTGAGTAGALGLAGKGISKLISKGGAKAATAAEGNAISRALGGQATKLEESSIPMIANKKIVDPEATRTALVQALKNNDLEVSAKGINQLKQLGRSQKISALAAREGEQIPLDAIFTEDFTNQLRRVAANKGMDPDKVVSDYIQRFRNNPNAISINPTTKTLPYAELDNIKNDFHDSAKKFDNKNSAIDNLVYNQMKTVQEANNPALSEANRKIAQAIDYYKPTLAQEQRGGQTASTNLLESILPVRQIINNQVKRKGAKVLQKAADVVAGAPVLSLPGKGIGETVNKLGSLMQNPQLAAILTPLLKGGAQVSPAFAADGTQGPSVMADASSQLPTVDEGSDIARQLIQAGMKASDVKNLQDIGAIPKPKGDAKSISAAERKQNAQAQAGLRGIQGIQGILSKDSSVLQKSVLPEFLQDENTKAFKNYVDSAAESYGRLQSGGAISKPEEENFKKQIYTIFSSPASQQQKLQLLNQYFTDTLG